MSTKRFWLPQMGHLPEHAWVFFKVKLANICIRFNVKLVSNFQSHCQSIEAHAHNLSVNIAKQEFHYIDLHSWYAYGKNKTFKYIAYTCLFCLYTLFFDQALSPLLLCKIVVCILCKYSSIVLTHKLNLA